VPVPANSGKPAGLTVHLLSVRNSNPGIRRPRWGGVAEGVAGQIRHPLAYEMGVFGAGLRFGLKREGGEARELT